MPTDPLVAIALGFGGVVVVGVVLLLYRQRRRDSDSLPEPLPAVPTNRDEPDPGRPRRTWVAPVVFVVVFAGLLVASARSLQRLLASVEAEAAAEPNAMMGFVAEVANLTVALTPAAVIVVMPFALLAARRAVHRRSAMETLDQP